MGETNLITMVCDIIPRFQEDNPTVTWRAFFCLHIACAAQRMFCYFCKPESFYFCVFSVPSIVFSHAYIVSLMWFSAEILAEIARNGVHEMIPDAYEMNSDPK